MSKRKAAIEEAAAIAEGIYAANAWQIQGIVPDFYELVVWIKHLRQSLNARIPDGGFVVESGRIRLEADEGNVGIYVHIGDYKENA